MIVLKATQDKVLAALQSVAGIVERRHTLPILANVLIRKTGGQLQLTTSDLEIQIRTTAELGGDEGNFTTTIGARKLIDILRTMPADQTVSLESSASKLVLKGGKSRFTLQSLPAEDFPLVQEAANFGPVFSVPQKTLKDLLEPGVVRDGGARHPLLPERHPVRRRRQAAEPGRDRRPPPGLRLGHARRRSAAPGSDPAAQDGARNAAPAVRRRRRDRDAVRQQPGQVQLRRHGVRHQAGRGQVPRLQPRDPEEPQEHA